jgi:N-hydroxyarylamine O-acetyltransferase
MDLEDIYQKIVEQKRGGYCFELNGALAWLLRNLGYNVKESFGRWHFSETDPIPSRRHRVIQVYLENETYIVDAGVGRPTALTPLLLRFDVEQERNGMIFRVKADPVLGYAVQIQTPEGFRNFYSFQDKIDMPQDFIYVNYYLSTHPDSIFRKKLMINLPAPDGRRSIYFEDGAYVFRVDGMEEEYIQPDNMARLKDVLAQSFNIIW